MSVKETLKTVFDSLPDDVSWEEAQYRLYLEKIAEQSNAAARRELSMEAVREIIEKQDEEAYRKYVCDTVEESILELDAGLGIPHEEAEKMLKKWLE